MFFKLTSLASVRRQKYIFDFGSKDPLFLHQPSYNPRKLKSEANTACGVVLYHVAELSFKTTLQNHQKTTSKERKLHLLYNLRKRQIGVKSNALRLKFRILFDKNVIGISYFINLQSIVYLP